MRNLLQVLAIAFLGACAIPTFITTLWIVSIGAFNLVDALQIPAVIMLNGIAFFFCAVAGASLIDDKY